MDSNSTSDFEAYLKSDPKAVERLNQVCDVPEEFDGEVAPPVVSEGEASSSE